MEGCADGASAGVPVIDTSAVTDHARLCEAFRWEIPETFNIAESVCGRHARTRPDLPAVIMVPEAGPSVTVTFGELADRVARVAGGHKVRVRPLLRLSGHWAWC